MKIEAIKFAKILKLAGEIAETLGYGEDGLQFLGWAETPGGDINITLTEKVMRVRLFLLCQNQKRKKMKAFDLKKAIAGEPVLTRDNQKGYVKFTIENDLNKIERLVGIVHNGSLVEVEKWFLNGNVLSDDIAPNDIVGMWEEPSPRVQLNLPCPLKKWRRNCYTITNDLSVEKTVHTERPFDEDLHFYFATEKDAQEWLNAMRNSRL